ncbi:MAG: 16S rRNA (adenine(1518)-N(6)/adenine(1519)-N(6))-dimethyltransferase RsmA [Coriobacteriales bacterium]|jgi:16S rRNA (adenine1518-N6/adenine1519-N6)-dimethyltransferase|nr:16S rRNA (adenine(1518)-N(6)/adenine(1519)-N(6))-dimethyltransferase RsmA [Coriobacteriales bacterium]
MTRFSPLASPSATKAALAARRITTKKSLGQHFLIDDGIVGKILRLAELSAGDAVLEVGPGIGTLTEALLLQGASVLAIEKDDKLLSALAELQERYPASFSFIHADALDLLGAPNHDLAAAPSKLIANLPYAVAATIVLECFQRLPSLESATVMVQAEVAARMAAHPGSKDYGAYSVKLQLLAEPAGSFSVGPQSFLPPPRVDSTVLRLNRIAGSLEGEGVGDEKEGSRRRLVCTASAFHRATTSIIEAAFAQRRKTIRNSMRSWFSAHNEDPALVDTLLASHRIDPKTRGETLTVNQYRELGASFAALCNNVSDVSC